MAVARDVSPGTPVITADHHDVEFPTLTWEGGA